VLKAADQTQLFQILKSFWTLFIFCFKKFLKS
jgi:hypothetical protein